MDKENSKNQIGGRLKELRLAHGCTQAEIAAALDIRQQAYSHYETGRRIPSAITLYKIASYYGVPVDDLLHLLVELDDSIYFDAPGLSPEGMGFVDYTAFMAQERLRDFSIKEKELLYYFQKLDADSRDEVVRFAIFRLQQQNGP